MKRIVALALALVFSFSLTTALASSAEEQYDFMKFRWGDSIEQVIAVEGKPTHETDEGSYPYGIGYLREVEGLDALLGYYFKDNGLWCVLYELQEEHSNETLFIDDYNTLKNALTAKYGEPYIDNENWDTEFNRRFYQEQKGHALSYGYLYYETHYVIDRTTIEMMMYADNYEIVTLIYYIDSSKL